MHGNGTFPPLDKRNTRDKVKGLRVASERYIGELGVTRSSPRGARYGLWECTSFTRSVIRKSTASHGGINRLAPVRYSIVKSLLSLLYKSIT